MLACSAGPVWGESPQEKSRGAAKEPFVTVKIDSFKTKDFDVWSFPFDHENEMFDRSAATARQRPG
jgi:hypothetical protein